jgi:hypothetical protein
MVARKRVGNYIRLRQRPRIRTTKHQNFLSCFLRLLLACATLQTNLYAFLFLSAEEQPRFTIDTTEPQTEGWNVFLIDVRKKALQFTDDLPDFICLQVTHRYTDPQGGSQWGIQDIIEAEVAYNQRQESYSHVTINGRSTAKHLESLGNAISIGEFGSILRSLFMPETHAKFWKEGDERYGGIETKVIGFSVPEDSSAWTLSYKNTHSLKVAYQGRMWVDPRNGSILRINQHTLRLPARFPILYSETTTEYGYRIIRGFEGQSFLLPLAAEVVIKESRNRFSSRNLIEFREFKKFTADVKLKAD